jgi:hypothetical protein
MVDPLDLIDLAQAIAEAELLTDAAADLGPLLALHYPDPQGMH